MAKWYADYEIDGELRSRIFEDQATAIDFQGESASQFNVQVTIGPLCPRCNRSFHNGRVCSHEFHTGTLAEAEREY